MNLFNPIELEINFLAQVVVGPGGLTLNEEVSPSSSPEDIPFREEVLDCFPEADSHLGYPLPEHLPQVRSGGDILSLCFFVSDRRLAAGKSEDIRQSSNRMIL